MGEQISLFNDDALRVEAKSNELTLIASRGRPLTKAQQTFNRLIKRIEALRSKIDRETRRLRSQRLVAHSRLHVGKVDVDAPLVEHRLHFLVRFFKFLARNVFEVLSGYALEKRPKIIVGQPAVFGDNGVELIRNQVAQCRPRLFTVQALVI